MPDVSHLLMFIVGSTETVMFLTVSALARFYRRSSADEALVRAGAGGTRVYIGEGAFVMPVMHQLMRVSLKSIKLLVDRAGKQHALVTADKIKANEESVRAAARSFGSNNLDQHGAELIDVTPRETSSGLRGAVAPWRRGQVGAYQR